MNLIFGEAEAAGKASVQLGSLEQSVEFAKGATRCQFMGLALPVGPGRLAPVLSIGDKRRGVLYVEVRKQNG